MPRAPFYFPDRPAPSLAVRNFDPRYKAFDDRDGKLYLPPEQRIRIW